MKEGSSTTMEARRLVVLTGRPAGSREGWLLDYPCPSRGCHNHSNKVLKLWRYGGMWHPGPHST